MDVTLDPDGLPLTEAEVIRNVVDEAVLADQVGVDFIGVGEHHRADFAVSSPETVLAAIAGRTERVVSLDEHSAVATVIEAGMAAADTGNRGGSTTVLARVAEATRAVGDRDTTRAVIDMELAESAESGQPWWDSALLRMRAELVADEATTGCPADLDDPDHPWGRAASDWRAALEIAERFGFPVHGARAAPGYAGLLQRVDQAEQGGCSCPTGTDGAPRGRDTPTLTALRVHLEALGAT